MAQQQRQRQHCNNMAGGSAIMKAMRLLPACTVVFTLHWPAVAAVWYMRCGSLGSSSVGVHELF
jgi:hypothetical protein